MTQNKTTENNGSVTAFLNTIADETKRTDSFNLIKLFEETAELKAKMWGTSIVGFGRYHYKYESGREGDAPLTGFSPGKNSFSLYLSPEFKDKEKLLADLGKYKAGKACIYIKRLNEVNLGVLVKMVSNSIESIREKYP